MNSWNAGRFAYLLYIQLFCAAALFQPCYTSWQHWRALFQRERCNNSNWTYFGPLRRLLLQYVSAQKCRLWSDGCKDAYENYKNVYLCSKNSAVECSRCLFVYWKRLHVTIRICVVLKALISAAMISQHWSQHWYRRSKVWKKYVESKICWFLIISLSFENDFPAHYLIINSNS